LIEAVRKALSSHLNENQIVNVRETGGKVLVTVAVDVATAEKPAFAEKIKAAAREVEGVKEVFVSFQETQTPQGAGQAAAQPQQSGPNPLEGIGRIIAVGAGKGGVGKSTVAVNLALALAKQGKQVGVLDADIYGPSAAMMTGTTEHQARGDAQQRVIPANAHGLRVISIAFLTPKDQAAVVWRGPMVGKMVTQLLTGVAWGKLDYLVVDLPPGTGDAVLSLSQTVPLDGAIVVTTPQDVALLDVEKAIEMFAAVKVPVVGVVENMAGFTCPECDHVSNIFMTGAGEKAAKKYGLPLLGSLPLDGEVPPSGDHGTPITVSKPDCPTSKGFFEIAQATHERLDKMAGEGPGQFDLGWSSGA